MDIKDGFSYISSNFIQRIKSQKPNSGSKTVYYNHKRAPLSEFSSLLFRVKLSTFYITFQVKLEQNVGKPSRVIHIRNIPNETTEAEIIQLGLPFGRVTNVLVLKGKNQVNTSNYMQLFNRCRLHCCLD